jgi:hypothetical protein
MYKHAVKKMEKIASFGFGCMMLFFVIFAVSAAHRFHTTLTLIDYNEKEQKGEISIQMFTHDVNEIFEKKYPKKFDLEKKEEVGKRLFEFIEKNFVLKK